MLKLTAISFPVISLTSLLLVFIHGYSGKAQAPGSLKLRDGKPLSQLVVEKLVIQIEQPEKMLLEMERPVSLLLQ